MVSGQNYDHYGTLAINTWMELYPQVEFGGDRPTLIRPELRRRQCDLLYVEHRIDKRILRRAVDVERDLNRFSHGSEA